MLALSTTLSMTTPALALQEPSLPSGGASVFVDDVRVSAGDPATAKIHVKHDNIGVQTGTIKFDIPAATTGIANGTQLTASHNSMTVSLANKLKTTGVGNLGWRSPTGYLTETDINLTVPNVSATTKIGLEVTQISGRAQGADSNTKISLDKVNAVSGSFIVQYPVTVKIADDSEKPNGAAIKVKTTNYNNNNKDTFDKDGQTETDVYNGGNGGTFYVDSGAGQQNAPVLEFAVPENYYAEVTVGNTKKNTVATSSFTLSEITANTDVSVKLIAGKVPADTISTANITYKYGKYDLGTDTKQFDKKGTANSVAPKDFTAEGYTVYQYKLNENAEANIDATGTVNVDLTKDTNTVVFYYKRNDNSTVLPGPDNTMPGDDDIIVKPTDSNTTLTPDGDGAVTFPESGTGGTVSDKNGNSMVVPGGTKVDKAGNIYLPGSTDPVKPGEPNTVPAGWYQVTYKYENTKLFIQLGKENKTVEALDWPSSVEKPAGKAFDGWNTMNSGVGGESFSVKDPISGPKTLYAQWTEDYVNKLTITFYPNLKENETADDVATQVIGNSVDTTFVANLNPNKTFTKDGWTLAGWNEQQNGSGTTYKVNGQITRTLADSDLSLYAMWIKTGDNSITVPGKDGIPGNTDDATANGSATQKPTRKDDGSIDVPNGGSVTTEGGKEYPMPNGGTLKPNGDIIIKQPDPDKNGSIVVKPDGSTEVLKPNGDKDDTKNAFKVTYKSGEAGKADKIVPAVDSTKVVSGDQLFTYDGHKFAYWTKQNGAAVENVAVNTVLQAATELTAHWYTVGDNGEIIVKPNPDENKEIVVKPDPTDPTNPDKKPKVDEDGNVVVPPGGEVEKKPDGGTITLPDGGVVTPGGDIKVPDKNGNIVDPSNPGTLPTGYFQIVYNANGGKGEMEKQTGKTITVKANGFKHDTLTFAGWNTKKNGSGKGYAPNTEATAADADVDAKTKTLTLYAIWVKKDDNGAITVPGKDGSIDPDTGKDNVTVKPNPDKPEEKPIQKPDGSIEIPGGGSGVIETPDKEPIVVPGGSVIKPDGTIEVPKPDGSDGKDTIDPSKPDQLPAGYFAVTYQSGKEPAEKDVMQIAKNGDKALSGAIFTAPAGKEFVNWKVQDADQSYNANESMNLTKNITLVAKWRNQGSGTTTYSAVVKYYNGKDTTPIKDEFTSDSNPMQRTLKNVFTSEETNGWKLLGYNGNDGKFYQPIQSVSLKNHDILELYAVWSKDGGNGTIVVPGPDGKPNTTDDITIKPNPDKPDEKPAVDGKGDVKVPDGGQITIPGKDNGEDTTVTVKPSAIVKPDGTIELPEGGTITVPGKDGKDDTVITGPGNFDPDKITDPKFDPDKPYKPGNGTVVLPGPDKKNGTADDVIVTPKAPDNSVIDDKGQVTLPDGGKVNFPQQPAGNGAEVTVPNGTVITPDGIIKIPEGEKGSIKYPDGTKIDPLPGGTEIKPDGSIKLPDGENGGATITKPDGSTIVVPGGTEIDKDGNITIPDNGSGTIKPKPDGSETDTVPGGATIDKDGRYRYLVSLKSTTGVALKAPNGYETTIWVAKGQKDLVVAPVIDNYTLTGESKFEVTGGQKVNGSYTITFTYKSVAGGGSSGGGGGGGGSVTSYVITASAGNGGTISPNGNVSVVRGSDKVFTITAKDGYRISNVIVDGESVGAVSTYTFRNVTAKHTIAASFIKVAEIPGIGPGDTGVDKWLRTDEHNSYITGYGNGLFGPENSVTRAQIAQIFYRLLKDQNVTATVNFSDVKPDAWYAEAVNALGSLGIISGVGKGKFDPDRAITRAEFCAVAARFAKVNSSADCPFDDVNTRDWYYQAVATAASYGWVTGMSDGSFHPNNVISRAQAATIINRMLGAAADRDFVDSHVSNPYKDVSPSYWAYYQIIEASIPHNHSYNAENVEIWNGLK